MLEVAFFFDLSGDLEVCFFLDLSGDILLAFGGEVLEFLCKTLLFFLVFFISAFVFFPSLLVFLSAIAIFWEEACLLEGSPVFPVLFPFEGEFVSALLLRFAGEGGTAKDGSAFGLLCDLEAVNLWV